MRATPLIPGSVKGEVVLSMEPLSFWGGYDPDTGEITDRRHPLSGRIAAGKVLAVPSTRGSSTSTAVLLEAQHKGNAPLAMITNGIDTFLALASIVADVMFHNPIPVFTLSEREFSQLKDGMLIELDEDGSMRVKPGLE
jgi:predicted aconitase with swiveling domain